MTIHATTPNPIEQFNLSNATARSFKELVGTFNAWAATIPPPDPLKFKDGWVTFTPKMSLDFLKHTALTKSNRRVSFAAVQYYAEQMKAGDWPKTGQPMIIDTAGVPEDGQHRAWSSVLSNTPFETYVVASVPPHEHLFAYMDNGKIRGAADALETAGLNGQSRVLAVVVRLARYYDANALTTEGKGYQAKASPREVMRYVAAHPQLRIAIHAMWGEYPDVASLMVHPNVAGLTAFKITELYGEDMLDRFASDLMTADQDSSNATLPLVALKKKLIQIDAAAKTMKAHLVLAHVIKCFNAWRNRQTIKKLGVNVDERYPRFEDPAAVTANSLNEAAE